ncbi:MAG: nuclear transport factor 2 family protein [Hyphomicrobiaceae bacterium]|nr:nuclear transport factor 2 family protein [Hyphomicrobiaceae bacterium]
MATKQHEELVDRYFGYIRELRAGDEEAVDRLVDLWDEDGVFEFAGASPVVGTFKGRNAIHTLYKNRVKSCGMPLKLTGELGVEAKRDIALGLVETHVNRMRALEANGNGDPDRIAVGWTTVIGTEDRRGFEVTGNHTFIFKGDRIASLKVIVSPKAEKSEGLALEGLEVSDIGRLSLAAWAVV